METSGRIKGEEYENVERRVEKKKVRRKRIEEKRIERLRGEGGKGKENGRGGERKRKKVRKG